MTPGFNAKSQRREDAKRWRPKHYGVRLGNFARTVCKTTNSVLASLRLRVFALEPLMNENEISKIIVDAAVEVHRELGGPGLIEDLYEEALAEESRLRCILAERQLPVRVVY